jgi:hypothetical protein
MKAGLESGRFVTELCRVGARRFTEPFFEDSIAACMRRPFNAVFRHRCDVETLEHWLHEHRALPLGGFIFHVSRCGSTLLSQLLASFPAHRVISEASPLDATLRAGGEAVDETTRLRWLRMMIGLLGQPANAIEQRLFVKFDSWHARSMALIARAYPEVPCVFLVRDPVEVIVSHLRQSGAQMVPGMLGLLPPGIDPAAAAVLPRPEYIARMVGCYCEAAVPTIDRTAGTVQVIDYADLDGAIDSQVFRLFQLTPDAAAHARMSEVRARSAKNPGLTFTPDTEAKRREADAAVHEAAERWAMPAYRRLRAL